MHFGPKVSEKVRSVVSPVPAMALNMFPSNADGIFSSYECITDSADLGKIFPWFPLALCHVGRILGVVSDGYVFLVSFCPDNCFYYPLQFPCVVGAGDVWRGGTIVEVYFSVVEDSGYPPSGPFFRGPIGKDFNGGEVSVRGGIGPGRDEADRFTDDECETWGDPVFCELFGPELMRI